MKLAPGGGKGIGGQGRARSKLGIGLEVDLRGNLAAGGTDGDFTDGANDDYTLDELLETGSFQKGPNWEMYKNAVLAMPGVTAEHVTETAEEIRFKGTSVAPFLSLFDVLHIGLGESVRWPGITPRFIKRIKDYAALQSRPERRGLQKCHVVLFAWKDDMEVGNRQSSLWNHYWNGFKSPMYYMIGTGPNAYGCTNVDLDESESWPAGAKCLASGTEDARPANTLHHILLDYRIPGFGKHAAGLMRQQWDQYWSKASPANGVPPDAFLAHDITHYMQSRGNPTNRPTLSDPEQQAWENAADLTITEHAKMFSGLGSVATLWGGQGRMSGYGGVPYPTDPTGRECPSLRAVYWNFMFTDMTPSLAADQVDWAAARDYVHVSLGVSNIGAGQLSMVTVNDDPGWWTVLKRARLSNFEDRVSVVMVDRGNGSQLFWHPAMRPLT